MERQNGVVKAVGFRREAQIAGAPTTLKEVNLLRQLSRRQRGEGFGPVEVTRYSPGTVRPARFYRAEGR